MYYSDVSSTLKHLRKLFAGFDRLVLKSLKILWIIAKKVKYFFNYLISLFKFIKK